MVVVLIRHVLGRPPRQPATDEVVQGAVELPSGFGQPATLANPRNTAHGLRRYRCSRMAAVELGLLKAP